MSDKTICIESRCDIRDIAVAIIYLRKKNYTITTKSKLVSDVVSSFAEAASSVLGIKRPTFTEAYETVRSVGIEAFKMKTGRELASAMGQESLQAESPDKDEINEKIRRLSE